MPSGSPGEMPVTSEPATQLAGGPDPINDTSASGRANGESALVVEHLSKALRRSRRF